MARRGAAAEQREAVPSKEQLLAEFESFMKKHHEGEVPETGLVKVGHTERKEICDDAKLKNREKGISLVADGISFSRVLKKEVGWFASNRAAEFLYEELGEKLDQEIENILSASDRNGDNPLFKLTDFIRERIESSILAADQRIHAETQSNPEVIGSSTTLSFTKLVELPDGKGGKLQRLFFANVGDSRIAVLKKGGEFLRLTEDDNELQRYVEKGSVSEEELRLIDQASHPRELPDHLRRYVNTKFSQQLTNNIGHGNTHVEVRFIDVEPGDKYITYTDGLGQLTEDKIRALLLAEGDDNQVEQRLQRMAMEMSVRGQQWRAEADDISLGVQTVEERGPSREYLKGEAPEGVGLDELKERVQESAQAELAWRKEKIRLQRKIVELGPSSTRDQLLGEMIALEAAKKNEAWYEAHKEQQELSVFESLMPRRFEAGDKVSMWRDDLDPPGFDLRSWDVMGYEPSTRTYTVKSGNGKPVQISRYQLEMKQPVIPRAGDTMAIKNRKGEWEPGWTLLDRGSDGKYVYAKEIAPEIFKYERVSLADANAAAQQELFLAEKGRKRMLAAVDRFKDLKIQERRLIDEQQEKEAEKALEAATRRAK